MTEKKLLARRDVLRMGGAAGLGGLAWLAGTGPSVSSALAQSSGTLKRVNIVNTGGNSNLVNQELLKTQGFLDAVGLEAVHVNVADGAQATQAILSGKSDICMLAGAGPVPPAIESGVKLKILAGANLLAPQAVFAKRADIKSVKDLEGKTVGTGTMGAALHQKMVQLLRDKGVDEKKVTFVNIGSTTAVFQAVVAGKVDAGPADIDVYEEQARYGVHALTDGNMWSEMPLFTNQASYSSDAVIAEKRDVIVRALAAYARLYRFLSSPQSKDAFVGLYLQRFKSATASEPLSQWSFYQKYQPFAVNLVLSEERIRSLQELNVAMGLQKNILPFSQVADMSLARDAVQMIGSV